MSVIERGEQVPAGSAPPARTRVRSCRPPRSAGAAPGGGAVRCCAHSPARPSKASASSRCKVRRIVGLRGHRPGDPSLGQGLLISVGGPFGDRGERARPGQHRAHRQAQDHRQPVAHPPAGTRVSDPASTASRPGGPRRHLRRGQRDGRSQGQSAMMTGRAWSPGSDLAGVGTAMITQRAMPALLSVHHRHATRVTPRTLPTPWSSPSRADGPGISHRLMWEATIAAIGQPRPVLTLAASLGRA